VEWSKVKSILIALLLVVDAILGVTVAAQYVQLRDAERDSLAGAAQLLRDAGLRFDEELFSDMPVSLSMWTVPRDAAAEERAARALLGASIESEAAGGGITVFEAQEGRVTFRAGGIFEALRNISSASSQSPEDAFSKILLALNVSPEENGAYVTQRAPDGAPIVNARLQYSTEDGTEAVTGLWIFADEETETRLRATRAELLLALRAVVPEQAEITACSAGYVAREERTGMRLEPIWRVTADETDYYVSALTLRQVLPFGMEK